MYHYWAAPWSDGMTARLQHKHPYDQDGDWEESFGTHKDTKPRGTQLLPLRLCGPVLWAGAICRRGRALRGCRPSASSVLRMSLSLSLCLSRSPVTALTLSVSVSVSPLCLSPLQMSRSSLSRLISLADRSAALLLLPPLLLLLLLQAPPPCRSTWSSWARSTSTACPSTRPASRSRTLCARLTALLTARGRKTG